MVTIETALREMDRLARSAAPPWQDLHRRKETP